MRPHRDFVSGKTSLCSRLCAFNIGFATLVGDARFAAGAGFTSGRDASDRVVYDTSTGNFYYDADGSDAHPAQLIGTLQGAPSLAATDITTQLEPRPTYNVRTVAEQGPGANRIEVVFLGDGYTAINRRPSPTSIPLASCSRQPALAAFWRTSRFNIYAVDGSRASGADIPRQP